MVDTAEHLMSCGFQVIYGYTQSDEISLLFDRGETSFGRKLRKYQSILAGEASAKLSLLLGNLAVFDCRAASPSPRNSPRIGLKFLSFLLRNLRLLCEMRRWRVPDWEATR